MNKEIMKKAGFTEHVEDAEKGICPFCKSPNALQSIKNKNSLKEFYISGLCQKCQNKTFGVDKKSESIEIPSNSFCYDYPPPVEFNKEKNYTYKKIIGKSGKIWVIANIKNAASEIFVSASSTENEPGYKGFRGFGGSILKFNIEDGSVEELKGPWHTNSDSLFSDTDYDIRDQHLTMGVVALKREKGFLTDILYEEKEPVLGIFDRLDMIAVDYASKLETTVYLYRRSNGGSSCGIVDPVDLYENRDYLK